MGASTGSVDGMSDWHPAESTTCFNVVCLLLATCLKNSVPQPEDATNPLSSSSATLPEGVNEVHEQPFRPPRGQRGEGQPSPALRAYLGAGSNRNKTVDVKELIMLNLFLWVFTLGTLSIIARHTNSKATEVVNKKRCTGKNGKIFYKVCTRSSHACM